MIDAERIKAAIQDLYPDHITPVGKRILEKVIDAEQNNDQH